MRLPAAMFVGLAIGVAAVAPSHAIDVVLLPAIPNLPARLGSAPGMDGATLGTSVQGSISITDPVPNPGIQSAADVYSTPLAYAFGAVERQTSDSRSVAVGTTSGSISSIAVAEPGKLRAAAIAGGGGGSVTAVSNATAMFVDSVLMTHPDDYAIDWNVHGSVSGGYAIQTPDVRPRTRPAASARIQAQVWIIPFGVNLAQAAQSSFLGSLYLSSTWTYDVAAGKTVLSVQSLSPDPARLSMLRVPGGARFWIVGMLEVTASRGAGDGGTIYPTTEVFGVADFMNTVTLTIDSVSAPGQPSVVAFSGHDYLPAVPVPEPATALMLLGGGGLVLWRRRAVQARPA